MTACMAKHFDMPGATTSSKSTVDRREATERSQLFLERGVPVARLHHKPKTPLINDGSGAVGSARWHYRRDVVRGPGNRSSRPPAEDVGLGQLSE